MTSIFENTTSKVTIHILHDDTLTDENRQNFIRTAEKYSQGLNLIDVSKNAKSLSNQVRKAAKSWTIGAMYRLFIPDVLPALEKVIYLDCDIIVNLDISELWNIDIEDKSFAAAPDDLLEVLKTYSTRNLQLKLIHVNKKLYVNSGVLVMNLRKICADVDFSKIVFEWMERHTHLLMFSDQDALNSIFSGDIKILAFKFNMYKLEQDLSGCIIHMWRGKPWVKFSGAEHERIYWRYYLLSAWGDNITPESMMIKLSEIALCFKAAQVKAAQKSGKLSLLSIVKSIWHKMPDSIQETYHIAKLLLKDIHYRIKRR